MGYKFKCIINRYFIFNKIAKRIKQRGFTIVELLVVIVVIGILAGLLALYFVGMADKARRTAFRYDASIMLRSVITRTSSDETFDPFIINKTNLQQKLNINTNNYAELSFTKSTTNDDYVYVVGQQNYHDLIACGTQSTLTVYDSADANCSGLGSSYAVDPVNDPTPGIFGGGVGTTCATAMTIDSIEDLVALSSNVNSGTSYSGKCIKLNTDLDFDQKKSYVDFANKSFGDVNGNGTVEELKTGLTTARGFTPIGNNITNFFKGQFRGSQYSIYDLYINRPLDKYVGLFGYMSAYSAMTISNLNLKGVEVAGQDYTGAVLGYGMFANLIDITISGNVTGNNYVGMTVGSLKDYGDTDGIVAMGSVTGNDYVGGLAGFVDKTYSFAGINNGVDVVSVGVNVGRIIGGANTSIVFSPYGYALATSTVNGVATVATSASNSKAGTSISNINNVLGNINASEQVMDTYIGGDNDNDGYYWDYDSAGKLVERNTTDNPLTFSLAGSGTAVSPYLINDYESLRQATLKLGSTFRLTTDLDLCGKRFYMFGSSNNKFTGKFLGNQKTISNLNINSPVSSYLGFSGYHDGIIENLNLNRLNIVGNDRVGGAAGYMYGSGDIIDVNVSGNVTGRNYVGLVFGQTYGMNLIKGSSAQGTVSGADYVGGIGGDAGQASKAGDMNSMNAGVAITATGGNVGWLYGSWSLEGRFGYALASSTINGSPVNTSELLSKNGTTINSLSDVFDNINAADQVVDTYIGGDNDGDGYYWDYDSNGYLVEKSTASSPLTFSLSGSGTTASPYLITNYTTLKQATLKLGSVYKLTADIDLYGKQYYMFGSSNNGFSGTFNGGGKTISNLMINAPYGSYMGFVGRSTGGTVKGLNLVNTNISGNNCIGGVVGCTALGGTVIVKDVMLTGTNISAKNYAGLITGYAYYPSDIQSVVARGDVSGGSFVGGLVGYAYQANNIKGVYASGAIIATGSDYGRVIGGKYSTTAYAEAQSNITMNGLVVTSALLNSLNGKSISAGDLSVQATYTDVGFNFTDEVLDYIWYFDGGVIKFREGNL